MVWKTPQFLALLSHLHFLNLSKLSTQKITGFALVLLDGPLVISMRLTVLALRQSQLQLIMHVECWSVQKVQLKW